MDHLDIAVRVIAAVVFGGAIGLERQWRQRGAGLRTNALVSTGAAAFVTLSVLTPGESSPTRIAAQVVSGIGFLGAGVIIREGLNIRGIDTAATLWCSAAVGALTGSGFFALAAIMTGVVVLTNTALRPLGPLIERHHASGTEVEVSYQLTATCREPDEQHLRALLMQAVTMDALMLRSLRSENVDGSNNVRVQAQLITDGRQDRRVEQLASRLSIEPGVTSVSWQIAASQPSE
jgi:putative Mg2+ transporter-C (MgtC) family protein